MATSKGGGSTRNHRDSRPQYRGIKRYGGQLVKAGEILVRQCGTKYHPGTYVGIGRDDTLYALKAGWVVFCKKGLRQKRYVSIDPVPVKQVPVKQDESSAEKVSQ